MWPPVYGILLNELIAKPLYHGRTALEGFKITIVLQIIFKYVSKEKEATT